MNWIMSVFWSALFTPCVISQGVVMKKAAEVYYGEPSTCSRPATIEFDTLKKVTDEWKRIESEGIKEGTATYTLLMNAIRTKINNAVADFCLSSGHDMVCEEGHIKNSNGLNVEDVTTDILPNLVLFCRKFNDFVNSSLLLSSQGGLEDENLLYML
jgi:hypothetical protein